jgi:hypothetical protein
LHGAFAACACQEIFAVAGGGSAGKVNEFFVSQLSEHWFDESKRESELAADASCCEASGLQEKSHDDAFDDCGGDTGFAEAAWGPRHEGGNGSCCGAAGRAVAEEEADSFEEVGEGF